jgi:hypothetical protein
MLTPRFRLVSSRIRSLNRSTAFGAIRRFGMPAPSKTQDAPLGKSFVFIPIVARSAVMGTLLRAVCALLRTLYKMRSHECETRHAKARAPRREANVFFATGH